MENSKKASFVRKMGKKRLSLSKVKRKHYGFGDVVSGLVGAAGGLGGSGMSAPSGTDPAQMANAYNQAQGTILGQTDLLRNMQAQQGLQKQGDVYGQLQGVVSGQGPNPAQAQLAQATGQNVANQGALMAGQRGAGANAGLMARQAAQQGANTQQQAAGQAASLQAQQSLGALGQAGNMANTIAGQQIGQTNQNAATVQNEQNILQGANTANNNITGGIAGSTIGKQQQGLGSAIGLAGSAFRLAEGGEVETPHFEFVHKMAKMGLDHHVKMNEGGKAKISPAMLEYMKSQGIQTHEVAPDEPIPEGQKSSIPQPSYMNPVNGGQVLDKDPYKNTAEVLTFADGGGITPITPYQIQQPVFTPVNQIQGAYAPAPSGGGMSESLDKMSDKIKEKRKAKKVDVPVPQQNPNAGTVNRTNPGGFSPGAGIGPAPGTQLIGAPQANMSNIGMSLAAHGGEMHSHFDKHFDDYFSGGGEVPALVSPGEVYLNPEQVHQVVHEGANPLKIGKKYKGHAKVKGDSEKNDTIPDTLEEGGVVIDREHVMSPEKAALFVHRSMAKKRVK